MGKTERAVTLALRRPEGCADEEWPRILASIQRAAGGDTRALAAVQGALRDYPAVWTALGDLAHVAEESWIATIAGETDLVFAEGLRRTAAAMRAELAGETPTPLERLLVERIVACWLQVQHAETLAARNRGRVTRGQEEHDARLTERAQRKELGAIKTLATVRRLLVPAVQVNIAAAGGQQVNVAP